MSTRTPVQRGPVSGNTTGPHRPVVEPIPQPSGMVRCHERHRCSVDIGLVVRSSLDTGTSPGRCDSADIFQVSWDVPLLLEDAAVCLVCGDELHRASHWLISTPKPQWFGHDLFETYLPSSSFYSRDPVCPAGAENQDDNLPPRGWLPTGKV